MTNPQSDNNNKNDSAFIEDEISLVDLWLTLVKRKKLIGIIILLAVLLGGVFAFVKSPKYKFYTTIQVGLKVRDGKVEVIEEPKQLLARIEGNYIPLVLNQINKEQNTIDYELDAGLYKDSQVIVISGEGPLSLEKDYNNMLGQVIEEVKKDHDYLIKLLREEELIKRNRLQSRLGDLNDQIKIVENRFSRIEQSEKLLKQQIVETKSLIESGLKNRDKAIKQAKDEAHAMTVMLIENGLQENRRLLAGLENRLYIDLAHDRDILRKQLADMEREKKNIDLEVEKYLLQEGAYRNTRVILEPIRSRYPVGQSKRLILALSVILGLFIAIFAAFFAEFLSKVKEKSGTASD